MKPDWEAFGKEIMKAWPEGFDLDPFALQDAAVKHGILTEVPGGYDPQKHTDPYGCAEPGDQWFFRNFK